MPSLEERIKVLEADIAAPPMRISAYHDLPFAIFRYDPWEEYEMRKRARLLAIAVEEKARRKVVFLSLGEMLWRAVRETEGIAAIASEERQFGFERAQRTVSTLLSDPDFRPLRLAILDRMKALDPERQFSQLLAAM